MGGGDEAHVDAAPGRARRGARPRAARAPAAASPAARAACRRSRRGAACRPRPARSARGGARSRPEKAPRSWPNSSLSSSADGIAAQLTATKRPLRPEARCSARATRSLPVPVSPVTSTSASVGPTRATSERTCSIAGLLPTRWPGWASARWSRSRSSVSAESRSALRTAVSSRSGDGGFSTKSVAPSRSASTASPAEASPESTTTGSGERPRAAGRATAARSRRASARRARSSGRLARVARAPARRRRRRAR